VGAIARNRRFRCNIIRTSLMRLPVVEATLMVLVFLEWLILTGEALEWFRVCLTKPSAILFLDSDPLMSASSRDTSIFCCKAARFDSCMSCDSWLEAWLFSLRLLPSLSLPGGVKTRSISLEVELVACEPLVEPSKGCPWLPGTAWEWELRECAGSRDALGSLASCDMSGMLTDRNGMGEPQVEGIVYRVLRGHAIQIRWRVTGSFLIQSSTRG
jgi:hypothetical protein